LKVFAENAGVSTGLYAEFIPTIDVPIGGKVVLDFPNTNPEGTVNWWANFGIAAPGNPVNC
jgi:hypothetical protein